jgi:hypothetical protein
VNLFGIKVFADIKISRRDRPGFRVDRALRNNDWCHWKVLMRRGEDMNIRKKTMGKWGQRLELQW